MSNALDGQSERITALCTVIMDTVERENLSWIIKERMVKAEKMIAMVEEELQTASATNRAALDSPEKKKKCLGHLLEQLREEREQLTKVLLVLHKFALSNATGQRHLCLHMPRTSLRTCSC